MNRITNFKMTEEMRKEKEKPRTIASSSTKLLLNLKSLKEKQSEDTYEEVMEEEWREQYY